MGGTRGLPLVDALIVKQILLGVAGGGAEMRFSEPLEGCGGDVATGKVELFEGAQDPDVDREHLVKTDGEQEDAVGDLAADPAKANQVGAGCGQGQGGEAVQAELASGNGACGGEEVGSTKPGFAGAEVGFGGGGQLGGGGEGKRRRMTGRDGEGVAEALGEGFDDLADLDDLFGGGEDEGGEAFPGILAEEPEAGAGADGGAQGRVRGETVENGLEVAVELEVMGEPGPVGLGNGRFGAEPAAVGMQADPASGDDAFPGMSAAVPTKGLAGVEGQIEGVLADRPPGAIRGGDR